MNHIKLAYRTGHPSRGIEGKSMMQKLMQTDGWLAAVVGGAVALPLSIVVHELGHFWAYGAFGFPEPTLHPTSAGWTGAGEFRRLWWTGQFEEAAAIAEPWMVAVAAAAGPAVSYLTAIGCVLAVRRLGPGPLHFVLGLGLSAPLHGLGALNVFVINTFGGGFTGNQDDGNVGLIAGISPSFTTIPGMLCVLLVPWFLITAIRRGQRIRVVVPVVGGMGLGAFLWISWLGPLLLP